MEITEFENTHKIVALFEACEVKLDLIKAALETYFVNHSTTQNRNESETKLLDIDFNSYKKSMDIEKSSLNELIESSTLWENYNVQYKAYYGNRLLQIKQQVVYLNNYDCANITTLSIHWQQILFQILSNFYNTIFRNTEFDLFENFKYGNKNYVLFGKNGAGKTRLLKRLSTIMFNTNSFIIPANRSIDFNDNYIGLDRGIDFNQKLNGIDAIPILLVTLDGLQNRNLCDSMISIFNNLGTERKLNRDENQRIYLYENGITSYSLAEGSHGEKSIVYMLLAILQMPLNVFCFIDEPERHLNSALLRKLFDELERTRPDIKFIYATHNISFIESRQNMSLIYLEKTRIIDSWRFNIFNKYDELPLDIILNIEGTNDNVIFCEGEDRNSFDCKLYEILYPNYEITPAHGCDNVIRQTQMLNKYSAVFKKQGYGIVDNDFRQANDINSLKIERITVLPINEIENIYITDGCLSAIKGFMQCTQTIDEIKSAVIEKIKFKQSDIKKDFATKLLRRLHRKNKFDNIVDIENAVVAINEENKVNFMTDYNLFLAKLETAIKESNYEELQKLVPGKMLLNDVAKIFGLSGSNVYVEQLLLQINHNVLLQNQIITIIAM